MLTSGEKFFCVETFQKFTGCEELFPRVMENLSSADFAAAFTGKKILAWTIGKYDAQKSSTRLMKLLIVEPVNAR